MIPASKSGASSGIQFSGFREIVEDDALNLADDKGILLGVFSNYVVEAARVLEYLYRINYRKRKVFAFEMLSGPELYKWRGHVLGTQQTPRFAHAYSGEDQNEGRGDHKLRYCSNSCQRIRLGRWRSATKRALACFESWLELLRFRGATGDCG